MSRHTVERRNGRTIVVGWDNQLATFFSDAFQEAGARAGGGESLLWSFGNRGGEIPTMEALVAALDKYGVQLNEHDARQLAHEASQTWEPGTRDRKSPLNERSTKDDEQTHQNE